MLAVSFPALLPEPWVAARVKAGKDADQLRTRDEVDGVGEAAQEDAARLAAHDRVTLRHARDLGEGDIDGAEELIAEAGGAFLIPARGFRDVRLGRLADDEAHASAGLVQAPFDTGAHDRPTLAGLGVARELREATVQFGGLRLAERQLPGLRGDAVPEILGELDALGDGEPGDVEVGGAHGPSLPRAADGRNTRAVDIALTPRCTANVCA